MEGPIYTVEIYIEAKTKPLEFEVSQHIAQKLSLDFMADTGTNRYVGFNDLSGQCTLFRWSDITRISVKEKKI